MEQHLCAAKVYCKDLNISWLFHDYKYSRNLNYCKRYFSVLHRRGKILMNVKIQVVKGPEEI